MSGGSVRNVLFDQPAILGSRMGAQLGRSLHWQGLVDEAKHNEANPGRAETKAAINAALWYLGGEAAGAAGEGGSAAGSAASTGIDGTSVVTPYVDDAAGIVGTSGLTAGSADATTNAGLLAAQAPQATTQTNGLLNSLTSAKNAASTAVDNGLYRTMVPGVGSQQADMLAAQTGDFGPYGLGQTMQAASGAQGLSPAQSAFGNYAGNMLSKFGKAANSPMGRQLAMRQGVSMMTPHQQQPMPRGMPAQGQQGPLTNPYQNPYGPGGNSMGLTEEQKQRLRMMGYQV